MRLRLSEDPKEWRWHAFGLWLAAVLVGALGYFRGGWNRHTWGWIAMAALILPIWSWIWPRGYRPVYRGGMRVAFAVGRVVSAVMLGIIYLGVVTPVGWVLRGMGKDLLGLRSRADSGGSYWQPATRPSPHDRMF